MTTFWIGATVALVVMAGLSAYMEHKRNHRDDIEKVGFMPWNIISVLSLVGCALTASLAIRGA